MSAINRGSRPCGWRLQLGPMTSHAAWEDDPFPSRSADDLDHGWGDGAHRTSAASAADPDAVQDADSDDDERLLRDVPPHYAD